LPREGTQGTVAGVDEKIQDKPIPG